MLIDCLNEFNSEDYIELIFREGALSRRGFLGVEEYCIIPINEKWSLVSVPVRSIPEATFEAINYSAFPMLYGLADLGAVNASGVTAVREQPVLGLYGTGTYIAIIDTGINWRHEAFIKADNTTRIKIMWDQESNTVYTEEDINAALAGETSEIPQDEIGHGTFMAGIASGNINRNADFSGVAPLANLIVVKLKQAKRYLRDFYFIKDGAIAYSETDLMLATQFVIDYAEQNELPVSMCVGVGSALGSHAGTSPFCDLISDEAEKTGRCITIAAGNEGVERLHFEGRISDENTLERVEINVGAGESGFSCELWSNAPEIYTIEIISPTGQIINRLPARTDISTRLNFIFENTTIYIYYKQNEARSGKNLVVIRFKNPAAGIWTLNVYGRNIVRGEYDIWMSNREFISDDTYFLQPAPQTTITEPGNTMGCITVAAYDSVNNNLYIKNGRGYTSMGVVKPDFCAPGVNIIGPSSLGTNTYEVRSGTSVAAAFYTGMAALIQEFGTVRNNIPYLQTNDIKNITITGCVRLDGIQYPSPLWGYGVVNLYNSIENLRRE